MPKNNRRRAPFYRRRNPQPEYDIRLLRPPSLSLGERFETVKDAPRYSLASEQRLDLLTRDQEQIFERLNECRTLGQRCGQPYCPICARRFRIWFIGELLRIIAKTGSKSVHIMTVLLKESPYDNINRLGIKAYDGQLRKRLSRNGLADAVVIGGYENVYRAKTKTWVLHINLVVIGATIDALEKFQNTFATSEIAKPVVKARLKDLPEQLSYILKFTTYHRPLQQRGPDKGPALPLNPREHCALVSWMAQWEFQDFMFMSNARREGPKIVSGPRSKWTF